MENKKIVGIGNFGIENVKIGLNKDSFPGGAGFRFALFAALYGPSLKIFTIVDQRPMWSEALGALRDYGVDIEGIKYCDSGISFYTFYNDQGELLKFRIVNSRLMSDISKLDIGSSLDEETIFHICPLDYDSQARLVQIGIQSHTCVSIQMHYSSINSFNRVKYIDLIGKSNLVFMTGNEASLLTEAKSIEEAGKLLSKLIDGSLFITRGSQGITVWSNQAKLFDALPIPVTNPANLEGAGDAFAAGVVAGLVKTNDIRYSTILGLMTAATCIQFKSTREVIRFISQINYEKR